ncbi:MAG: carboxypeptidase regulatory-like domain-containing protein, partial [Bryobacteraceae bacterium]
VSSNEEIEGTHMGARILFPLLASGYLYAQTAVPVTAPPAVAPSTAPATDPTQLCTLEGKVVHATTGEPIRKTQISLMMMNETSRRVYSAASDPQGKYKIEKIEPGRYTLAASRPGFVRQTYGARSNTQPGGNLTLAPAQKMTGADFKMTPQGVILGRVVDEDGDPVQYSMVQVSRAQIQGGQRRMVMAGSAMTNDIGEFRVANLPAGRFYISATGSRNEAAMLSHMTVSQPAEEQGYATVYYPGVTDVAGAAPIEIQPGSEIRGMDIRLVKQRVLRVRGKIIGGTRQPAMVLLMPKTGDVFSMVNRNMSSTRPDGEFEIRNVTPGSYILSAQSADPSGRSYARMPIEVGESHVENLVLTLQPSFSVQGRLRYEGTPPAQSAPIRLMARSLDDRMGFGSASAMVKEDGAFTLANVVADKLQLSAFGLPPGAYLKSVRLGEQEVLEQGLDMSGGPTAAALDVLVSMNAGQVTGAVTNDKSEPVSGAVILLAPDEKRAKLEFLYKQITTDQSGAFAIQGVAPGDYTVYAFEEVDRTSWRDPEYLRPHEKKGKTVTIRERSIENAQLKVIASEKEKQ